MTLQEKFEKAAEVYEKLVKGDAVTNDEIRIAGVCFALIDTFCRHTGDGRFLLFANELRHRKYALEMFAAARRLYS